MRGNFELVAGAVGFTKEKERSVLLGFLAVAGVDQPLVILAEELVLAVASDAAKLDVGIDELAVAGDVNTRRRVPDRAEQSSSAASGNIFRTSVFSEITSIRPLQINPRSPPYPITYQNCEFYSRDLTD